MAVRLGYVKTDEVKLVRRKHRIGFRVGSRAVDVASLLNKVPDDATVVEVIDYSDFDDGDGITIEFAEESTN